MSYWRRGGWKAFGWVFAWEFPTIASVTVTQFRKLGSCKYATRFSAGSLTFWVLPATPRRNPAPAAGEEPPEVNIYHRSQQGNVRRPQCQMRPAAPCSVFTFAQKTLSAGAIQQVAANAKNYDWIDRHEGWRAQPLAGHGLS